MYAAKGLDGSARVAIDVEVKQLQDALGGCERILRNPIPLSCECVFGGEGVGCRGADEPPTQ